VELLEGLLAAVFLLMFQDGILRFIFAVAACMNFSFKYESVPIGNRFELRG
jgi:hypothetical protein